MSGLRGAVLALPVRQLATFFFGSLAGVIVDLALFQGLVSIGAPPVLANVVSAAIAITITYFLVTRFTFPASASVKNYFLFFGWYAVSVLVFSVAIQLLAQYTNWDPFVCKLLSLPFSFAANFIASRLILGRIAGPAAEPAPEPEPVEPPRSRFLRILPLLIAWAALLVAAALLYFQVRFHSDSVFLEDLSRDLFEFGGDWREWRLSPAPAYFPDMLLYFAAYFLLPTVALRIFFVSFIQVILLGLAVMFVVRQLTSRSRMLAQAVGVSIVAVITLVCAHSDIWLYFYSTNNHFAALLLPLVGVGLMVSFLRRPRPAPLVWLAVFGVLGQVSTTVYIIAFTAPVILAMLVLWVVSWRFGVGSSSLRRGLLLIAAAVGVGAVVAVPVNSLVTPFDQTDGRYGLAGSLVVRGLIALLQVFQYAFGGGGPVVLAFSLTLLACALYLLVLVWRRFAFSFGARAGRIEAGVSVTRYSISTEGGASAFALWIVLWSLPIAVAGSVISGGIVDQHGYRYLLFPLTLMVVITAIHLVRTVAERRRGGYLMVTGLSVVVLLLAGVSLPVAAANPREDVASTAAADCLQELRDEGVSLDAGLADYWYGRGVTIPMHDSPELVSVWGTLDPFYWMSTVGPLDDPERYPRTYNFALVHPDAGGAPWVFNEDNLSMALPEPDGVLTCTPDIEIWTWDDKSMDRVVKAHFDRWLANNVP